MATDRLDSFDKIEWRDIARRAKPGLTDAEFERMWEGFLALKKRKAMH
jgi:hypothetical protein